MFPLLTELRGGFQMRPMTMLNGVLLASSFAISMGLIVVWLISLLLQSSHPELGDNFGVLTRSAAAFAGLTVVAAVAFGGQLRLKPWRWWAQAALVLGLAAALWVSL